MFETRESDISDNISKFFEKAEDPTQLINFLNTEEESDIYELRIGPKKLTSKIHQKTNPK
jgi:hypothetical protein